MDPRPGRCGVVLAVGLLVLPGCNKGPAEESLAVAEQTLEAARPTLEAGAPEDLAALEAALAEARVALAEGRYTDALRITQDLPSRVHTAVEEAESGRQSGPEDAVPESPEPPPAGPSPPDGEVMSSGPEAPAPGPAPGS